MWSVFRPCSSPCMCVGGFESRKIREEEWRRRKTSVHVRISWLPSFPTPPPCVLYKRIIRSGTIKTYNKLRWCLLLLTTTTPTIHYSDYTLNRERERSPLVIIGGNAAAAAVHCRWATPKEWKVEGGCSFLHSSSLLFLKKLDERIFFSFNGCCVAAALPSSPFSSLS